MRRYALLALLLICSVAHAETIAEKLTRIDNEKKALKSAIESKGQSVTTFETYSEAVASITSESGIATAGVVFVWEGGKDWTLATSSSLVDFQEDYISLFNSITNASGTNGDTYNSTRYYTIAGLSGLSSKYTPTFSQTASSTIGTYTQGPAAVAADGAFIGGVLMPNGKVCLAPFNSDYVGIYDPIANTYTQGPAAVAADGAFAGGVLMPNGKVCLAPHTSNYVGIYDPIANTYTQGPAAVAADGAFAGGVLMPNGKVCLVPSNSDYVGIYDNGFTPVPLNSSVHPLVNKF
jgi:hypothetical protein